MVDFTQFSHNGKQKIDQVMVGFLQKNSSSEELTQSMTYSILAGGKRFRPLLMLATIRSFESNLSESAYQVASALEMAHCYSLIHDDLPAMDNDDLRRGKPTNHKVYGEATAILAGDALLTESFALIAATTLSDEIKIQLIQLFASAAGSNGMIAGQMMDMQNEKKKISLDELKEMHQKKTGALIEFAVKAGCLFCGCDTRTMTLFESFAYHLGIAFQIRDDLLDVLGDEEVIGKKIGMDQEHDKSTYVSLLGVDGAKVEFEDHGKKAAEFLVALKESEAVNDVALLEDILKELMVVI
ncbi:polyprenyl synthetase family protein [Vagococcus silagei]|uniref:Farnesyl diphosphate synthase n=1 Tax=Vagococcus silagei TaxID=2508885 RepID=A0A4V3TUY9_9ENTE|nr:farnesyl diphosphate synthase [Vagococcus silagei]THB60859.1 polyprenyl synthetase family protein [Vagococcus silagei]